MRKKVKLTQQHIRRGKKNTAMSCPVALACKDTIPELNFSISGPTAHVVFVLKAGVLVSTEIRLPKRVAKFVDEFDKPHGQKKVRPFNFYLDLSPAFDNLKRDIEKKTKELQDVITCMNQFQKAVGE